MENNRYRKTTKMFRDQNKYDLVTVIEEDKNPMSDPQDQLPMHVIPD